MDYFTWIKVWDVQVFWDLGVLNTFPFLILLLTAVTSAKFQLQFLSLNFNIVSGHICVNKRFTFFFFFLPFTHCDRLLGV